MKRLLLILAIPIGLQAQDTTELSTVIVSDNRIETSVMESARNIEVLTKREISALPAQNVNEVLQHIAGVDFRQRGAFGAQADVSIRGGSFDQCLILVNGIKVSDPQTGHHNMNLGIALSSIEKIEVIKGPAAARYGLNTFSGVINIITKPEEDNTLVIGSSVGQSQNSRLPDQFFGGYEASGAAHFGGKRSRHMVSGSRTISTGYRPNTDLNRRALMYQSETQTKIGSFDAMGMYNDNAFGASGFYAFPIDSGNQEEVQTVLGALQHTKRWRRVMLRTKVYSRKNFDTYTLFRNTPEVYQNKHRTDVEGGELHGTYSYSKGTLGVGVEYRHEAINSTNLGMWERDNMGVFVENRLWLFKERLSLNTGAYINQSSNFGMQILPSIEASYALSEAVSIFGTAGQSFRLPTYTDLYYVGPTNIGNADLKPEKSTNYEGGVKFLKGRHFVQASGFFMQATDLIDWVRDSTNQPWQPKNYENVSTSGVDINYELRLSAPLGNSDFSWSNASFGYTYLDMKINSAEGTISRYALNNLHHQLTMRSTLTFREKLSLSPSARYLDRTAYKSYWLIDLRLKYAHNRTQVWADCVNLLDTHYIEAGNAPMPGRWFRLGFDWIIK